MRKFIPAFEFRRRAREAMLPVMSILVVVMLIAMLPSLVSNIVTAVTESDPNAMLADLYTEENLTAMLSEDPAVVESVTDQMMAKMTAFFAEKWPFMALSALVTLLLGPVLGLGFFRACGFRRGGGLHLSLGICRGRCSGIFGGGSRCLLSVGNSSGAAGGQNGYSQQP